MLRSLQSACGYETYERRNSGVEGTGVIAGLNVWYRSLSENRRDCVFYYRGYSIRGMPYTRVSRENGAISPSPGL
jgi:hypothetical protein